MPGDGPMEPLSEERARAYFRNLIVGTVSVCCLCSVRAHTHAHMQTGLLSLAHQRMIGHRYSLSIGRISLVCTHMYVLIICAHLQRKRELIRCTHTDLRVTLGCAQYAHTSTCCSSVCVLRAVHMCTAVHADAACDRCICVGRHRVHARKRHHSQRHQA